MTLTRENPTIEKLYEKIRKWTKLRLQSMILTIANTRFFTFHLDLRVKVPQNVAHEYPLHHVTYAPAKFEVARKCIYKKHIIWPMTLTLRSRLQEMLPSTLCIMWHMHLQSLKFLCLTLIRKRCIYKKIHYLYFDLDLGAKVILTLANIALSSTSCDLYTSAIILLLCPRV